MSKSISNILSKKKLNQIETEEKQFAEIKAFPKNRWFNSLILISMIITFTFIGVILGCLIIIFA